MMNYRFLAPAIIKMLPFATPSPICIFALALRNFSGGEPPNKTEVRICSII